MNVQFAVRWEPADEGQGAGSEAGTAGPAAASTGPPHPVVYVLEVNPRASRTVPFVAKATGLPVAKVAAKVMAGVSLAEQGVTERSGAGARVGEGGRVSVHQVLGRRYRARAGDAFDGRSDGRERAVFDGVRQEPARGRHGAAAARATSSSAWPIGIKRAVVELARRLVELGFSLLSTSGTADVLEAAGVPVRRVKKLQEGQPNLLDYFADRARGAGGEHAERQGARTDGARFARRPCKPACRASRRSKRRPPR